MKHLDLFSGIGGFALAAGWAGFETVAFCEKDKFCQQVLRKHWPDKFIYEDIKTMHHFGDVNLLTGGFPCQPFSVAGKKKGKNDERHLWPEMLRVIKECRPTWIIAENVTGIVEMEFENILVELQNENYRHTTYIIPACAANAPHRRDRLWIVANRNGERCHDGIDLGQTGYLQDYEIRYVEEVQSKWERFKPITWAAHTAKDWLSFNTRISRSYDGLPDRMERIKSVGNAIVPQVVYPILKFIYDWENNGRL